MSKRSLDLVLVPLDKELANGKVELFVDTLIDVAELTKFSALWENGWWVKAKATKEEDIPSTLRKGFMSKNNKQFYLEQLKNMTQIFLEQNFTRKISSERYSEIPPLKDVEDTQTQQTPSKSTEQITTTTKVTFGFSTLRVNRQFEDIRAIMSSMWQDSKARAKRGIYQRRL